MKIQGPDERDGESTERLPALSRETGIHQPLFKPVTEILELKTKISQTH